MTALYRRVMADIEIAADEKLATLARYYNLSKKKCLERIIEHVTAKPANSKFLNEVNSNGKK